MKLYLSTVLLFMLLSCNYALFVHKKEVIYNQKGYILFYYKGEEALFFPWKDTVDNEFLSQNHFNGYKIGSGEKDLEYLKKIASSHTVVQNVLQNGQSIQVDEQVELIPVTLRYYWGENLKLRLQKVLDNKNNIKFLYSRNEVELFYKIYDHRYIMSITPTRKSDKVRIEKYIPSEQTN